MTLFRCAAVWSLTTLSLLAAASFAQQEPGNIEGKVDQVFAAYDKPDSPGCTLGIVRNGDFIYKKGYGLASLELGVPLTPQSVFYMGSVSKQFTAASVVLAAEQGYLSLDEDIRKYVPELPSYGQTITLRQMLHHTSGFRDILGLLLLSGRNFEDIHPTPELLDLLSRQKALNYQPGDQYLYSNTNFFLMSVVIHRATGKTLTQFADENIFKPLGMTHTRFYEDHTVVVPGRVPAYEPLPGGGFRVDWSTNFDKVGDGGLMSSVDDLLLWDRNFYDNKLGKGTLIKEMQTPGAKRMTLTSKDIAPQICERYEPIEPSAQDLAQYAGEYKSSELEATYRFAVKDGKLTLATNWQEPAVLDPSVRDEFQGPFGTAIVFRRNAAGHITGCDLFAGRVRNISLKTSTAEGR